MAAAVFWSVDRNVYFGHLLDHSINSVKKHANYLRRLVFHDIPDAECVMDAECIYIPRTREYADFFKHTQRYDLASSFMNHRRYSLNNELLFMNISYALYLDSDAIVIGDVSHMLNTVRNHTVVVAKGSITSRKGDKINTTFFNTNRHLFSYVKWNESKSFNAGVFSINVQRYSTFNISQRMHELYTYQQNHLTLWHPKAGNQPCFNLAVSDIVHITDMSYNCRYSFPETCKIRHRCCPNRKLKQKHL